MHFLRIDGFLGPPSGCLFILVLFCIHEAPLAFGIHSPIAHWSVWYAMLIEQCPKKLKPVGEIFWSGGVCRGHNNVEEELVRDGYFINNGSTHPD